MSRRKNVDIGKNRHGLDMGYFRSLFDRELNKPLADFTPKELARVLARASRTADPDVMHEPEFLPGMAIVPVEPTLEMINAALPHAMRESDEEKYRAIGEIICIWDEMLAAAKEKGYV